MTFPHHLSNFKSPHHRPCTTISTLHFTSNSSRWLPYFEEKKSTNLSRTVLALILFLILSVSITGATNAAAWGWPLMTAVPYYWDPVVSRCTSRLVPVFNDPAQLPPPFVLLSFFLKWNESNKYIYNIFIKSTTTALYYYPFHYHHQFWEHLSFKLASFFSFLRLKKHPAVLLLGSLSHRGPGDCFFTAAQCPSLKWAAHRYWQLGVWGDHYFTYWWCS